MSKWVSFTVTEPVEKETDAAILVEVDGVQHWIPKSQISEDSEVYEEGQTGELVITEWIATEKGIV